MGKKDVVPVPKQEAPTNEAEEEDTPTIKALKVIDDKFCTVEVELEQALEKLRKKYNELQAPLLEERRKVLSDSTECAAELKEYGTPGCQDFWLTALSNAGEFEELLQECDEPVLKYLDDISWSHVDPEHAQKGIRLEFKFKENPYFTNDVLWLETHFDWSPETYKPYKDPECSEVKSCTIEWKPGKNVTVEKRAKDAGGKKGGKKKPTKVKEEPCPSFFRILFTSAKLGEPLPEGLECVYNEGNDDDDEDEDLIECHMENMGEVCQFVAQQFVPYAVRYYTGEACDSDDDDDSESGESEDDDDDDDSDEESDEPVAKAKGKKKPAAKKGSGDAAGEKTEECKQQ